MNNNPGIQADIPDRIADRLTVILGVLGLLRNGAFGELSSRQKSAIEEVLATSDELNRLLRDYFDP